MQPHAVLTLFIATRRHADPSKVISQRLLYLDCSHEFWFFRLSPFRVFRREQEGDVIVPLMRERIHD